MNDAALTSSNILAHSTLFQLGFAGNVIAVAGYLAVTALWYRLLKPVNENIALVAALIGTAACVILGVGTVLYLSPLAILNGASSGVALQQAQGFALLLIRLYGQCYNASLIFFALFGILTGYLAFRSTFIPPFVGIAFMIAGFGWLGVHLAAARSSSLSVHDADGSRRARFRSLAGDQGSERRTLA
jgi:hypothetical protein